MHPNSDPASTCHRRCRVGSRKAGSSAWILAVFATWLIQAPVAHADYVADKQEIAAMKARILKNPPTAEILAATPYPGAKLDANCSADFSATNQSEPMVYCYYTHDAVELVKAYIGGAGKPGKGVWTVVDRDDVVENGNVMISDVTFIKYYVSAKEKAKPDPPAAPVAAAPANSVTPASPAAPATTPAAPEDRDGESAGAASAEAARKGVETVKKLKGLFGG